MRSENLRAILLLVLLHTISDSAYYYFNRNPIRTIIFAVIWTVLYAVTLKTRWPKYILYQFNLQAVVVSAVVFDGEEVLLVKDDLHQPPWLVPPSAHVGCFTPLKGGPHQAVITAVKGEAGISIEIDGPYIVKRGATQIPHPFMAQSEDQQRYEGHSVHHDYYYVGSVVGSSNITKTDRMYEWVPISQVSHLKRSALPRDLVEVIASAFEIWKKLKQTAS